MSLLTIVLVSLLWRLPSWFDPPWVNDEGTYFAVAQAMSHGYRLYADIWENKPPGLYLLYSAVYHSLGASLVGARGVASLITCVLIVLTYRLTVRPVGVAGARWAALLVGLVCGVPFLEGTTLNAELPMAAFAACAVYLAVERERPTEAGVCMVMALAFKANAGFDGAALGIWFLVHHRCSLPRYLAGAVAGLIIGMLFVWQVGILGPMLHDAFLYDLGYVSHGNGGAIPWLLAVKVLCLMVATVALRRAAFFHLWAVWAVAGAVFSGRVFGHYALQAVVPLVISSAVLLGRRVGSGTLVVLPATFVSSAALAAVVGWALASYGHDSIFARRLQYYANFGRYALHTESYSEYSSQIDDHVLRNQLISSKIVSEPSGKLLVWGNAPWVYVLSDRLPATPYTSALRQPEVPGETAALRESVADDRPTVVVVINPPRPALGRARLLLRRHFSVKAKIAGAIVYVRASNL